MFINQNHIRLTGFIFFALYFFAFFDYSCFSLFNCVKPINTYVWRKMLQLCLETTEMLSKDNDLALVLDIWCNLSAHFDISHLDH